MPYCLLRHAPLLHRKAFCWLIDVEDASNIDLASLTEEQLNYFDSSQVVVEHVYPHLTPKQITNVLANAKLLQDFWWPAFLIVASLDVVYAFLPEYQKGLGSFGQERGGVDLLQKAAQRNLSHCLQVVETTASVQVIEVDEFCFKMAIEDIFDAQEKVVLQVFTLDDADKCRKDAADWAELLEKELQAQLDKGVQWEEALSTGVIRDKSLFRRQDVL